MKARHRRVALLALISLVAACGGDDRSATTSVDTSGVSTTTSTEAAAPSDATAMFVIPDGGEPTERQLAMVAMVEPYIGAWQANDGDAVASSMTPDGYLEYPEMGWTFRADDGTLQDRVDSISDYATLQSLAPMTVYGDRIALPGRIDSMNLDWVSIIQFTPSGELQVMRETLFLASKGVGTTVVSVPTTAVATTTSEPTATFVVPGGGEPTERQLAMVAMVEPYIAAWQANDGDGVASFMTPTGYVEHPDTGEVDSVDDGTLQNRVNSVSSYATLRSLTPMTVHEDLVVLPGRIDSMDLDWLAVVRFTPTGELKILSQITYLL